MKDKFDILKLGSLLQQVIFFAEKILEDDVLLTETEITKAAKRLIIECKGLIDNV